MLAKDLKRWLQTVHDDAIVEVHRYSWESLKAEEVRASWTSSPSRTMDDVCNVEQVTS